MTGPTDPDAGLRPAQSDQPEPSGGGWPPPSPAAPQPLDDEGEGENASEVGWPEDAGTSEEPELDAWLEEQDVWSAAAEPAQEDVAEPAVWEPLDLDGQATDEPTGAEPREPWADVELEVDEPGEQLPDEGLALVPVEEPPTEGVLTEDLEHEDLETVALEAEPEREVRPAAVRAHRTPLLAALVAVLLGLTAFLAVAAVRTRGIGADEQGRRDSLSAARASARLVFSYDYRHLDKDFAAGRATTTGAFRDEYTRTTTALTKDGVPGRYKAVVVADVSDAAVVTGDRRHAVVLVFLDQQSTSTLSAAPKITQSRVEMRLVRKDGRWLVEEIDAL